MSDKSVLVLYFFLSRLLYISLEIDFAWSVQFTRRWVHSRHRPSRPCRGFSHFLDFAIRTADAGKCPRAGTGASIAERWVKMPLSAFMYVVGTIHGDHGCSFRRNHFEERWITSSCFYKHPHEYVYVCLWQTELRVCFRERWVIHAWYDKWKMV